MPKDEFYHFEEAGADHGSRSSGKLFTPARVIVGILIIGLIGALIGVIVHYESKDDNTGPPNGNSNGNQQKQTGGPGTTTQQTATSGIVTQQTPISTHGHTGTGRQSTISTHPVVTSTASPTFFSHTGTGRQSTISTHPVVTSTASPSTIKLEQRIDCIPEAQGKAVNATKELCDRRSCVYEPADTDGVPDCFFDQNTGYSVESVSDTSLGWDILLKVRGQGPFPGDLEKVVFSVEMRGDDVIRFKFDDPVFQRYKVPMTLDLPATKAQKPRYDFKITNRDSFAFQIIRNSTGTVLWDTGVGGLVLADQFLQISTQLPSINVYGFGENRHTTFRHDLNHKTWPMWARDQPLVWQEYSNLYGVHPFYTCMEGDGNSHGVFLLNSNAQDYSFTPLPMLTYRTIGGILDFYMFLGPEPENVVQQYTQAVGRSYMPPYWSLGFHLCRYGYNSLENLQRAVNRTKHYNIPQDVQYADIDHMHNEMDFTIDKTNFDGLPEYFTYLRDNGMRTMIMLDPTLITNVTGYEPYDNLTAIDGAIHWPADYNAPADSKDSTNALLGYVWPPGKVVFPDFFKTRTKNLWQKLIVKHHKALPFDALWIDMNEPANFGTNEARPWNWPEAATPYWSLHCPTNNKYEDPPYRTKAGYCHDSEEAESRISAKTICMIARQGESEEYRHYDVHSLYGWSQAPPTLVAVREATGERSLLLSRSTFAGSGSTVGKWTGDNDSKWSGLAESIIGMLEFNLFGIPFIGADICGFFGNTTAELCKRWTQLGAFYTFSRNHNGIGVIEQDPGAFGDDVAKAAREALETRYWLLPYLYTLFHRAHTDGHTVARPLFHEFPKDTATYDIERQFIWGPALMIVPILEEGQTEVTYYLPEGQWYDFYTGSAGPELQGPGYKTRTVQPDSNIGLYVRAGHILPMQKPANNTSFSRKNTMKLLVALDDAGKAGGELFWDDGVSVDTYETKNYFLAKFQAEKNSLTMTVMHDNTPESTSLVIDEIVVYGAPTDINDVYLDQALNSFTYTFNNQYKSLSIHDMKMPLNQPFSVVWSSDKGERSRLNCYPEAYRGYEEVTKDKCEQRGCVYKDTGTPAPPCYFPQVDYGYKVVAGPTETKLGLQYILQHKQKRSPYAVNGSSDVEFLTFDIEMTGDAVLRFKFDDANSTRFTVPLNMNLGTSKSRDPRYEVKVTSADPFSFQVVRRSTKQVLWDTGVGGLTFSNQFLQIATRLPSHNIYGFGENVHHSFRHRLQYEAWPMWSRDQPVGWGGHLNHYGVYPFYTCMEKDGHSHGVLLLNSNAQDYSFTPLPMLTYRTIGGILDFYMFLGPEPENVVQQYTQAVGRPHMPPYWSLGFQQSRYGYNSLDNVRHAVERTVNASIPFDVQYVDIDHMDERKDFTLDTANFGGLNDYFKSLQASGMRTIIILDPTLISNETDYEPYENMSAADANIKWPIGGYIPPNSTDPYGALLGYVWPKGKVVFPDFFKKSTQQVWKDLIVKQHGHMVTFDGIWIDMNEPASFGTNERKPFNWPDKDEPYWSLNCTLEGNLLEHPPYRTMAAYAHDSATRQAMISDKTICMRAVQGDSGQYSHYDVHSLYGWSQSESTLEAVQSATGERGIVISRSTFPGSGKYVGHWLGDNDSVWEEMRLSIIGILEFNLFGIPYIGADICGFFGNTTPELCKRWMQLGAFYTFSRNHNGLYNIPQDPAALGEDVARASRVAMETRYSLLPYLYTLFHKAHVSGHTVIRPLHHEFPMDKVTYNIDQQFMWGPALLISPILYEGQTNVRMYLPTGPWYDFYTGAELDVQEGYHTIPVDSDSAIPLHVRAGHIIPMQAPANNTHYSRLNPFMLKVALEDSDNTGRGFRARGELFWDDGAAIDTYESGQYFHAIFSSGQNQLQMSVEHSGPSVDSLHIDQVEVMGVPITVGHVYFDGKPHTKFTFDKELQVLNITDLTLPLSTNFQLEWREYRLPTEDEQKRVDCYPDIDKVADKEGACQGRGCLYEQVSDLPSVPQCYTTQNHGYLTSRSITDREIIITKNTTHSLYKDDIGTLRVNIDQADDHLLRIKISDVDKRRYEVPVKLDWPTGSTNTNSLYEIEKRTPNDNFHIKITRKSSRKVLWDTSVGSLIFSDQFIQISTQLPSENLYGFGENRHFHLKHNFDYRTWPLFARDNAVEGSDYANMYGVHPFYMCVEDDGSTHGVLLLNSNAMEVVLEPGSRLTYRTIGGVLDFYFFFGPDPESVIQQYTQVVGYPYLPPYWSLGFQLCQYGYDSLDALVSAVHRTKVAGIPHDVQFADIDHMDERNDFTLDPVNFAGLPDYVRGLQRDGMHFIIIIDPGIVTNRTNYRPFDLGVEKAVFIKWPNDTGPADSKYGDYMLGYVWPSGKVVFPDFLKNETWDYWSELIVEHHNTLPFDGLWIDMNEPTNFGTNMERPHNWPVDAKPYWSLKCNTEYNKWDQPPYKPKSTVGEYLSDKTLCMVGQQDDGNYNHYDVHSLYGWSEVEPTLVGLQKATNKRGLVISRSTYPTNGRHVGHWLGDNNSKWSNMHDSIIGIIEFNLFGIPYIGADICGFFLNSNMEMCQRWMQLGAFYTFSRNHNMKGMLPQDPGSYGDAVADSSRRAMEIRYSLLPYLYTQFYHVHTRGGTVIRSMMHQYPADRRTWDIDTQFLWGDAFLIAPVLQPNQRHKDVYFPNDTWYDYYTGMRMETRGRLVTVDAPRDIIPLFVRGGYILPTQQPANNTVYSRQNPLGLIVAPDDAGAAQGDLFWDDGDSIGTVENGMYFTAEFHLYNHNTVTMTIIKQSSEVDNLVLDTIQIYGVAAQPSSVLANTVAHTQFDFNSDTKVLIIEDLSLPMKSNFTVTWS